MILYWKEAKNEKGREAIVIMKNIRIKYYIGRKKSKMSIKYCFGSKLRIRDEGKQMGAAQGRR